MGGNFIVVLKCKMRCGETMLKQIWFPEMVQHHIMSRHGKEDLNSRYYSTTYPDVYAAAERTFGSWGEAIESCGLDYSLIKKYKTWTRQAVLDEIRRLAKAGEPLFSQHAQDHHKPLYMAAIKRFGNWGKAIQAAGVDYKSVRLRRSMTKAEIKREVLALYNLAVIGLRLSRQFFYLDSDKEVLCWL